MIVIYGLQHVTGNVDTCTSRALRVAVLQYVPGVKACSGSQLGAGCFFQQPVAHRQGKCLENDTARLQESGYF